MVHIRRKLVDLVRKHQVDVVQTHLLNMLDFLVLTLRRDTGLPIVLWTVHNVNFLPMGNSWLPRAKRLFYCLLYRLTARKVSGFIAISDEVRESAIRQIGPIQNKIITIPNGVDLRRYNGSAFDKEMLLRQLGITPGSRLIVTVGRLTEQKGHCYLITAAAAILSRYPDAHFLFVGDGELKRALQAQVKDLEVSEHVHFLGVRSDVPDILAVADLFVLASLWEGLSIALLEAMASGKPIVATAVSGTTQVMTHGETGLIVPPGDARALADAILQLFSDPLQAQTMAQAARKHVEIHFSAQRQAEEYLALYHFLLQKEARACLG
jgi:glycosyltransferase involved in cell wall biosynthesis